jgi:enoyl-CoA hydratase/carnithine racemase
VNYDHYETIVVERDGDVLTLTLNRPEAQNAVNDVLHTELSTIFAEVRADPAKVIVITGAGDWFCHAGDFEWYTTIEEEEWKKVMAEGKWIIHDAMTVPQPIIVALNGPAMGIGCTIVGLGDIVIAAEGARIGDHHAGYGVVSGDGGVIFHPLSMGLMRAKQMYLLNKEIDAQELVDLGIATSVHPEAELMDEVNRVAHELAALPAEGLQWTKWSLNRLAQMTTTLTIDGSLGHQGWSGHLQPARDIREAKRFAYDEGA